jgi:Domain of unknown function (DUF222)
MGRGVDTEAVGGGMPGTSGADADAAAGGGWAAWRPPGPESASWLAALTSDGHEHAELSPRGLVEGVLAGRRLEGWALWCQLSMIAGLLTRWTELPPTTDDVDEPGGGDAGMRERCARRLAAAQQRARFRMPTAAELVEEFVSAEVSLITGSSRTAADARVLAAQVLLVEGRLPRTAALLQKGLLDWPKVHVLVNRLGVGLEPALAGAVEALVITDADLARADQLDRAPGQMPELMVPAVTRSTVPGLVTAVEAGIVAVDGAAAARRAQRAREHRRVVTRTDPDGMGRLEALTGQEHVAAMWNTLTAAAHAAKKNGDPRSTDQLRLDELVRRVTGLTPPTHAADRPDAGRDVPGDEPAESAEPTDSETRSHAAWTDDAAGSTSDARWAVSLTLPLGTFLGLADDPGVLDGYGPLPGALARRIAADATEAARGNPQRTTWRCVITDEEHGSVLGVGRAFTTPQHDPPERLADLVRAVRPRCVFPGCPLPAGRCDLDHRIPYDHDHPAEGGPTCECNLQPLCRTHHRLKTTGLIRVEPIGAGPGSTDHGLEWTTRAGLRYRTSPGRSTPAPTPATLQPLLDLVERQRRDGEQHVAWMNSWLRAAYTRGRREASTELLEEIQAELDAEIRHHDYGDIAARADPDDLHLPPEPDSPIPDEPAWIRAVLWSSPDQPDLEPDDGPDPW